MCDSQCLYWDFTLPKWNEDDVVLLQQALEQNCKDYVFQLEKGESGYLHFQGRLKVPKKVRMKTLKNKLGFDQIHLSPTSSAHRGDYRYVTKSETRVDGPWGHFDESGSDVQAKTLSDVHAVVKPCDIASITELRPWQLKVVGFSKVYDLRRVDVIIDKHGGTGKTTLRRWLKCEGLAQYIPPRNDFRDMMRMVMSRPISRCYVVDMPRSLPKGRLEEFYAGIEYLKGGDAYDDRYRYKEIMFNPPRVIVFTNSCPDINLLSGDRWRLHTIVDDDLVPYVHFVEDEESEDDKELCAHYRSEMGTMSEFDN